MIDLSQMVKKDTKKPVNIVYDKNWKVSFDLVYLSKTDLQALIGKYTKIEFNKKSHTKEENIDTEKLNEEIAEISVKGWHGVTPEWLATLIPIDMSQFENPKVEVDFTKANLMVLIKNAYGFDNWLIDTIKEASNFNEKKEAEAKN